MIPMDYKAPTRTMAEPNGERATECSIPAYATALNAKLIPITKTKLIHWAPEFHKGKSAAYFTTQEEVELAMGESVWVGIKYDEGKECGGSYQAIEEFVPDYCFKCKHQDHYEDECMSLPKADRPPQRGHRRDRGFQTWASSDQLDIPNITRNVSRPQALAQSSHGTQIQTNIDELSNKAIAAPAKLATNSKMAKFMKRHRIQNGIRAKLAKKKVMQWRVKTVNSLAQQEELDQLKQLQDPIVGYQRTTHYEGAENLKEDPKQPQIVKHDQALHDSFGAQHRPNNDLHSPMASCYTPVSHFKSPIASQSLPHCVDGSDGIRHGSHKSEVPNSPSDPLPLNAITVDNGIILSDTEVVEKAKSQQGIKLAVHLWNSDMAHNKSAPTVLAAQGLSYSHMPSIQTRIS
ncbi:hypothetical protein HAX54_041936 [Datura stramonium]|uniref:DUF4283 domain-containing protein n=1 Tax=Datura stramonium TaxID=4076 RepID=A0ABS8SLF3_DATST|nr:hypothetical protein [Datura stramonium]